MRFASELEEAQSPEHAFAVAAVVAAAAVQEPILRGLVRTTAEGDADQVLAGWAAWLFLLIDAVSPVKRGHKLHERSRNNSSLSSHSNFRSDDVVASVR